ncbi:MAG: VWA domain-containing protein, partial [Deltaproteobacteria bacterium]|nr:VWA domain-containing protein [Deltaproteobacteria bacterium]
CRSDADWVTPDRRIALELFSDFLSTPASQMEARQLGFRPALLDVAPVHPLTRELGVRLDLPKRSLAAPTGEFTAKLLESWPKLQRPLAIIFVVDASGSMQGGPLDITRQSIGGLISRLSDTDLTALISFSTNAQEVSPLSSKHQETIQKLNSLEAAGGSAFYDAVNMGIQLINQEDLKKFRKNLIVVVDGPDRNSSTNLPLLTSAINNTATRRDLNLTIIGITGQGLEQTVISEIAQAAGGTVKTTSPAALNETCEEIWKSM